MTMFYEELREELLGMRNRIDAIINMINTYESLMKQETHKIIEDLK